jgi:acyl-CoA reductase-like NAD-dependent aldehyde dehydrogenase
MFGVVALVAKIQTLQVGDTRLRGNWMGPLTTGNALRNFERYAPQLAGFGGRILTGGHRLLDGDLAQGNFVAPTLATAPAEHPLFREEMFLPVAMLCRVGSREEAMRLCNDSPLGLTAGCYGNADDLAYFFEHIEAGVCYANRPQGATTGAWPGYQPFGGWKGSGSTGKAIASFYYLAQYMREQSRNTVE